MPPRPSRRRAAALNPALEPDPNDDIVDDELIDYSSLQKESSIKLQRTTLNHVNSFLVILHQRREPGYEILHTYKRPASQENIFMANSEFFWKFAHYLMK